MNLIEKTQNQIIKIILNRKFEEDGFLPSEGEMATMFRVSRSTLREAVRSLEVRGYLKRVHGKGVSVVKDALPILRQSINDAILMQNTSPDEVIETRRIIEVAAAGLSAGRRDEYDLLCMQKAIRNMEAATSMDAEYFNQDMEFHRSLVKSSGNSLLYAIMMGCRPAFQDIIVTSSFADYVIEQNHHFHRDIYDCILAGDSSGAQQAMQRHFDFTISGQEEYRRNLK